MGSGITLVPCYSARPDRKQAMQSQAVVPEFELRFGCVYPVDVASIALRGRTTGHGKECLELYQIRNC